MRYALAVTLVFVAASARGGESAFRRAQALGRDGKDRGAVLVYLQEPGGEFMASRLARPKAATLLRAVRVAGRGPDGIVRPRARLVEGDMLLALGKKSEALACYRAFVSRIATVGGEGWDRGFVPREYYPVEPSASHRSHGPALPFTLGPGSHRDNWLIRRFVALEAWDDARHEFERMWTRHRALAHPYVAPVKVYVPPRAAGEKPTRRDALQLFRPPGFDGHGLQFAIDYAFFLKRTDAARSLAVLMEPLTLIDMDRNPVLRGRGVDVGEDEARAYPRRDRDAGHGRYWHALTGASSGISRKEYIRLAFGEFKTAGRDAEVVAALEEQIGEGRNAARRVLARIRLHQGEVDEFLALELAYIERGGFDELSAAYRRGLAYEDCGKLAEAAGSYERALSLPYTALRLPEKDEEAYQASMMRQAASVPIAPGSNAARAAFQSQVLERLARLYGALAQGDKVLEVSLRQYEANAAMLERFESLEATKRRFVAVGKGDAFLAWARGMLPKTTSANARANLAWLAGDTKSAALNLAAAAKGTGRSSPWARERWQKRFRDAADGSLQAYLGALVEADPADAKARLEQLDLQDRWVPSEVIPVLELLLREDAKPAFARGKGVYNRTRFRNYFDLAYRLMRLHEKVGELGNVRSLALRIARGDKPFGFSEWQMREIAEGDELGDDVHRCLALAVQHANDDASQRALESALGDKRWPFSAARRQLARRRTGGIDLDAARPSSGWANAPEGATLIASNENVLALARDESYVYTGHPWGIAVYGLDGAPVTRVALAQPGLAIAAANGDVWIGTTRGLYRTRRDFWDVAHRWLHDDVPENRRHGRSDRGPYGYWFDNAVYALCLDGEDLWIAMHRTVQVLNTRSLQLRAFSFDELKVKSWVGYSRILPDGEYVWVGHGSALRRYTKKTDTWDAVTYATADGKEKGVGLIAVVDGVLYGHVRLPEPLRDRPCIIDRETLAVTPVLIGGDRETSQRCINGPFAYYGKLNGRPVFGAGSPGYVLDPGSGTLRRLREGAGEVAGRLTSDVPQWLAAGTPWRRADGVVVSCDFHGRPDEVPRGISPDTAHWLVLSLEDGRMFVGGRTDSVRYYRPGPHRMRVEPRLEVRADRGGLFLVAPDGRANRVSSGPHTDRIGGDVVHVVMADVARGTKWVCTNSGVALLGADDRVVTTLDRRDGLLGDNVLSCAATAERVYFATAWDDSSGGLMAYDRATSTFTSFVRSDGLPTDLVTRVRFEADGSLRLSFGTEYLRSRGRGDLDYRRYPPTQYDPAKNTFGPRPEPVLMTRRQAYPPRRGHQGEAMPCLGGYVVTRCDHDGKTYVCGTRGLMIMRGRTRPSVAVIPLQAELVDSIHRRLLAEARGVRLPREMTVGLLGKYAAHGNPYVRANALAAALTPVMKRHAGYAAVAGSCIRDPLYRVRATSVRLLSESIEGAAVKPLRLALDDDDSSIRAVAALALARRGERVEFARFEEMLRRHDRYGNMPFGAESCTGSGVSLERIHRALAPRADRTTFELLMKYPLPVDGYKPRQEALAMLGTSLTRHPGAADVLLAAYDTNRHGYRQVRFAQAVFGHAGAAMLPRLHAALASDDRVVRSNAARGCGAIGDRSSVPHLIEALDLESGLSRASIVWALGELGAQEALDELVDLYVDARNDELRRRGSGFLAAQSAASIRAHYDSLRDLDAVGADWNELKAATADPMVDPRANEVLLSPDHVLEAVRKIGPAAAQDFYRALAGAKDSQSRREAAERLAEGGEADRKRNVPILVNLLADRGVEVRIPAAVSLLALGRQTVRPRVIEWLDSPVAYERSMVLTQLARIEDAGTLEFARARVVACSQDLGLSRSTRKAARALLDGVLRK